MQQGETERWDCDNCGVEFEVCLEPKMQGKDVSQTESNEVQHCPFCGSESIVGPN